MSMEKTCVWNREDILNIFEQIKIYYRNSIKIDDFVALKLVTEGAEPFEVLVGIILSQNTSDRNAYRALLRLKNVLDGVITPDRILSIDPSVIINAINVAGLANRRLQSLLELSRYIKENPRFFNDLKNLSVDDVRKALLSIYGIGYKTADVFLLMIYKKPTFPIDTHIMRVLKRLGIVHEDMGYEDIRRFILGVVEHNPEELLSLHISLIAHGRMICKARNPRCSECPINTKCCRIGVQ